MTVPSALSPNTIKARLRAGGEVIGSFVRIPAPESAEIFGYVGFDFVVIDGEHTPTDDATMGTLVRAAEAAGTAAFVRPASCEAGLLGRLLETGASGVHLPQQQEERAAAAAIAALRYAPLGTRGLSTGRKSGYGMLLSLEAYVEAANRELLVVVQIESREGFRHIDAIASLPGVDVLFVGLTDLSMDLGVPGAYDHPEMCDAIGRARAAADRAGLALGVPVTDMTMLRSMRAFGARYFATNDIRLLSDAARELLHQARASDLDP